MIKLLGLEMRRTFWITQMGHNAMTSVLRRDAMERDRGKRRQRWDHMNLESPGSENRPETCFLLYRDLRGAQL